MATEIKTIADLTSFIEQTNNTFKDKFAKARNDQERTEATVEYINNIYKLQTSAHLLDAREVIDKAISDASKNILDGGLIIARDIATAEKEAQLQRIRTLLDHYASAADKIHATKLAGSQGYIAGLKNFKMLAIVIGAICKVDVSGFTELMDEQIDKEQKNLANIDLTKVESQSTAIEPDEILRKYREKAAGTIATAPGLMASVQTNIEGTGPQDPPAQSNGLNISTLLPQLEKLITAKGSLPGMPSNLSLETLKTVLAESAAQDGNKDELSVREQNALMEFLKTCYALDPKQASKQPLSDTQLSSLANNLWLEIKKLGSGSTPAPGTTAPGTTAPATPAPATPAPATPAPATPAPATPAPATPAPGAPAPATPAPATPAPTTAGINLVAVMQYIKQNDITLPLPQGVDAEGLVDAIFKAAGEDQVLQEDEIEKFRGNVAGVISRTGVSADESGRHADAILDGLKKVNASMPKPT